MIERMFSNRHCKLVSLIGIMRANSLPKFAAHSARVELNVLYISCAHSARLKLNVLVNVLCTFSLSLA